MWSALPIGYLLCERRRFHNIENQPIVLSGNFTLCERPDMFKPNSGDHLFAIFAYAQARYLYQSTLFYEIVDVHRRKVWWAHVGLSRLIRKW